MFLPKTFAEILTTMVNYLVGQTTQVTDFNPGSVIRTMLEASAMEVERTYMQTWEGISDAVDSSLYTAFGFGLRDAQPSYGTLRLTRTAAYAPDISVPAGTKFAVPNTTKVYTLLTTQNWTGGASSTTFDITVSADAAGLGGNTPAASITQIVLPITGVASCSNPEAFITGLNAETLDERRQRFASYIGSLARGTAASLEFGAKTTQLLNGSGYVTEQVAKAKELDTGVGTADLYIHNGVGTHGGLTTTTTLLNACQAIINGAPGVPGWRAAGTTVSVVIATESTQVIRVVITSVFDGYTLDQVRAPAVQSIKDLVTALNISDTLRLADIVTAVRNVAGVRDCVVVTPGANVVPASNTLIVTNDVTASQFTVGGGFDASLT